MQEFEPHPNGKQTSRGASSGVVDVLGKFLARQVSNSASVPFDQNNHPQRLPHRTSSLPKTLKSLPGKRGACRWAAVSDC